MLKDITIGQYYPGKSAIHRLDARMKIFLVLVYIVMIFCASGFTGLFACAVLLAGVYLLSHIPFKLILKSMKPIIPILILTCLLNLFFIDGDVIFQWYFLKLTWQGLYFAGKLIFRIVLLIIASSLLTYTTTPIELTDGIERLLSPLRLLKFPVHELAMMMTIALRFIPTLIEETDKIMSAQKARGADIDSGGLVKRIKALVPVLIPLFISAFRRAEELALAMDCRCYKGGEGRTRMKQLKLRISDWSAFAAMAVVFAGVICINLLLPPLA